jgi:hypothetical protein
MHQQLNKENQQGRQPGGADAGQGAGPIRHLPDAVRDLRAVLKAAVPNAAPLPSDASAEDASWLATTSALSTLCRLAQFHPEVLDSVDPASVLALLQSTATSPRSALAKTSLDCMTCLLQAGRLGALEDADAVLATLLAKSANEKRFIALAAQQALLAYVTQHASAMVFVVLVDKASASRHPKIMIGAANALAALSSALPVGQWMLLEPATLLELAELALTCKNVQARRPFAEAAARLHASLGEDALRSKLPPADLARVLQAASSSCTSPGAKPGHKPRMTVREFRLGIE